MISIKKIKKSNIHLTENIENMSFGSLFTDHCFICNYKDGKWTNPRITPLEEVKFPPTIKALHYGQEVFEGMKAYKDTNDQVWLFRPTENIKRLNISSKRIQMPAFSEDLFIEGLTKLIRLEKEWVMKKEGFCLYIRPFIFASSSSIIAQPSQEYIFIILCCPVGSYFSGRLNVKIENKFSRAMKGGTGKVKAGGNYGACFYPTYLAKEEGFDEIIWLDNIKKEFLEEAGTMNIFVRIKDKLITPILSDTILPGITRKSIIKIAQSMNIEVQERQISVKELIEEHKKSNLKEIWGCGTATVVTFIKSFTYEDIRYQMPSLEDKDNYALILKTALLDIQYNRIKDNFGWTVKV